LNWIKDSFLLSAILESCQFKKNDLILDVGTGTGILAKAISPFVGEIIGIDSSPDMLQRCQQNGNDYYLRCDTRKLIFADNIFDGIVCRSVMQHIRTGITKVFDQCFRVLKKEKAMILTQFVVPDLAVTAEYDEIFAIKDNRIMWDETQYEHMMIAAGFKNIKKTIHWTHNFSVKNWIKYSGLNSKKKRELLDKHLEASNEYKAACNMRITGGNITISTKAIIFRGEKK